MYPTSQTFKRWASHATVADLGEVISICLDELRERIGPVSLVNEKGDLVDPGAI